MHWLEGEKKKEVRKRKLFIKTGGGLEDDLVGKVLAMQAFGPDSGS